MNDEMSQVERECVTLLCYLARHGYSDLHTIADATGISFANVQRYLNKECWEKVPALKNVRGNLRKRQSAWLIQQRAVNPRMYLRFVQTVKPGIDKKTRQPCFFINRSKYDILVTYAHIHHFEMLTAPTYPGFEVRKPTLETWNGSPNEGSSFHVIAATR